MADVSIKVRLDPGLLHEKAEANNVIERELR